MGNPTISFIYIKALGKPKYKIGDIVYECGENIDLIGNTFKKYPSPFKTVITGVRLQISQHYDLGDEEILDKKSLREVSYYEYSLNNDKEYIPEHLIYETIKEFYKGRRKRLKEDKKHYLEYYKEGGNQ